MKNQILIKYKQSITNIWILQEWTTQRMLRISDSMGSIFFFFKFQISEGINFKSWMPKSFDRLKL